MSSKDEKFLIIAFPSVGLVGAFAISYLTAQLEMKDIGELEISEISPSYVIEKGEAYGPVRIYNKDNIYAILAGIPINLLSTYELIKKSLDFAKSNNITKIIIPRGLEVDKNFIGSPVTYGLAVNKNSKSLLEEFGLSPVSGATVFGPDASVISALKKSDVPGIILYTTCRMMMPDDDAIIKSIKTLSDIIKVKVDTEKFEERLEKINKANQKMIEDTKKYYENMPGRSAAMPTPGIG
ncbi:PAC2 family protein [Nitrosopumilus sp. b3]|uniref:proteasome assembly chaperone family protein n=1 Tax=Nitrosopumilus sp. b3 TaxID=2109909 RepID=UPI0015F3FFF0|nr:PAC2 family protein [Nitrosopumilus sp. b3]